MRCSCHTCCVVPSALSPPPRASGTQRTCVVIEDCEETSCNVIKFFTLNSSLPHDKGRSYVYVKYHQGREQTNIKQETYCFRSFEYRSATRETGSEIKIFRHNIQVLAPKFKSLRIVTRGRWFGNLLLWVFVRF